jgi:basic membrane lipoprotein Med (substrate-binding protein (PBP1-ABC) superfamily)
LKKKSVKTKSSRLHEAYKTARNDVNRLIKNTKASYFQEVISNSKNNSKEKWRNINQLIGKSSITTNVTSVKSNDQMFTNKDDITETFNDYFSKIGTELSNRIPPSNKGFEEYLERSVSAVFEFKSLSNDEVETVLSKLKVSKTSGQDKIPVNILKDSSDMSVSRIVYQAALTSSSFWHFSG